MSLKLLADKYIELNVQDIKELSGEEKLNTIESTKDYVFLYCRTGRVQVAIDNVDTFLEENDIVLVYLNQKIKIYEGNYSCIYIAFNGASVDELIFNSQFYHSSNRIHDEDSHLGYYFYKMYHSYHEAGILSIKCLGILYELFYELTKQNKKTYIENSNQEKHVEMAKEYIEHNYHLDITIADVARVCNVTSNYLANIFSVYVKTSPKLYLTQIRMEQAKKLLLTNKYKIKEVGCMVGYKNQLHFSGEFKKYTGYSPMQYEKEFR